MPVERIIGFAPNAMLQDDRGAIVPRPPVFLQRVDARGEWRADRRACRSKKVDSEVHAATSITVLGGLSKGISSITETSFVMTPYGERGPRVPAARLDRGLPSAGILGARVRLLQAAYAKVQFDDFGIELGRQQRLRVEAWNELPKSLAGR